jgi:hypothetical protein
MYAAEFFFEFSAGNESDGHKGEKKRFHGKIETRSGLERLAKLNLLRFASGCKNALASLISAMLASTLRAHAWAVSPGRFFAGLAAI